MKSQLVVGRAVAERASAKLTHVAEQHAADRAADIVTTIELEQLRRAASAGAAAAQEADAVLAGRAAMERDYQQALAKVRDSQAPTATLVAPDCWLLLTSVLLPSLLAQIAVGERDCTILRGARLQAQAREATTQAEMQASEKRASDLATLHTTETGALRADLKKARDGAHKVRFDS